MMSAKTNQINERRLRLVSDLPQNEGTVTQRYRLLSKIGSGGMGDVFLGIQRGAVDFQRLIVLKRIHAHLLDMRSQAQMFIDEASLVASLNHPNIVKIIDFRNAEKTFYIVMEYVDGETLKTIRSVCRRKQIPLPFPLACKMILSACDALHYAHNATSRTGAPLNIIHRDIGLHNLMIDRNGYLKVIDFGIAKSTIQTDLTQPDLIKGNPSYMAPDIFHHEKIDNRVDIYALGLSLYELLTTRRAFNFKKNVSLSEVIQTITTSDLPDPSSYIPTIPPELDAIVRKATKKDREERYQTISEFAADLQNVAKNNYAEFDEINPRQWFYDNFSERISERIKFEQELLDLANSTPTTGISSYLPPPPTVSIDNPTRQSTIQSNVASASMTVTPKKPYLLIGIAAALLVVGSVIAFALTRPASESEDKEQPIEANNLTIRSEPIGAEVFIDGRMVGITTAKGVDFKIPTDEEHNIVLKKSGYQDYITDVSVQKNGHRGIDITLTAEKNAVDTKASAAAEASEKSSSDTPNDAVKKGMGRTIRRVFRRGKKRASGQPEDDGFEGTSPEAPAPAAASAPVQETSPAPAAPPSKKAKKKSPSSVPLLDTPKKNKVPLLDGKPASDVPLL